MVTGDRTQTLGVGAVGLGAAFLGILPSLSAHPLMNLVAAVDVREEARQQFEKDFDAKAYADINGLFGDPNVEVVYVATPSQLHAEHVIAAARHGKHVIVEKPLALSIEDCQAIVREVEKAGTKLVVGHAHSFDPPVLKMREVIRSGELGRLRMIHTFDYTDWVYRPRRDDELKPELGGTVVLRQVPHAVDSIRLVGGGLVRSVRAYTGDWDANRPTIGSINAFIEFEDGAVATVAYSGYGHFDSDVFHEWVGEGGQDKDPNAQQGAARRRLRSVQGTPEEASMKASFTYGGANQSARGPSGGSQHHEHFGVLIASCDQGDIRTIPDGIRIYGNEEVKDITVPFGRGGGKRATVLDEMYDALVLGKPVLHDGRWAMATLEVLLAILESGRSRKEVMLSHQVPTPD